MAKSHKRASLIGAAPTRFSSSLPVASSRWHAQSFVEGIEDWRHALDRFLVHAPEAKATLELLAQVGLNEWALCAPFSVAYALENYALLPVAPGSTLRLALIGAEMLDTGVDGCLYGLLPLLLGRPDLRLEVDLVGPQYRSLLQGNVPRGFVAARSYPLTLGQYLAQREGSDPDIDVYFIFHPGLEQHAQSWLAASDLPTLLVSNKPIIVFSYDQDEAARESYLLSACGARVGAVNACATGAAENRRILDPVGFHYARAMFKVQGFAQPRGMCEYPQTPIDAIESLAESIFLVMSEDHVLERHRDRFRRYLIVRGGQQVVTAHVLGRLYYDLEQQECFVACNGAEVTNCARFHVPLEDLEPYLTDQESALEKALMANFLFGHVRDSHAETLKTGSTRMYDLLSKTLGTERLEELRERL